MQKLGKCVSSLLMGLLLLLIMMKEILFGFGEFIVISELMQLLMIVVFCEQLNVMILLLRVSWLLMVVFSSVMFLVMDWLNVRLLRLGVIGQNCLGVNRFCEIVFGKRVWMKVLLMFVMYLGLGSGLLVLFIINVVIGFFVVSCVIVGSLLVLLDLLGFNGVWFNSVWIGVLIVFSVCDIWVVLVVLVCVQVLLVVFNVWVNLLWNVVVCLMIV